MFENETVREVFFIIGVVCVVMIICSILRLIRNHYLGFYRAKRALKMHNRSILGFIKLSNKKASKTLNELQKHGGVFRVTNDIIVRALLRTRYMEAINSFFKRVLYIILKGTGVMLIIQWLETRRIEREIQRRKKDLQELEGKIKGFQKTKDKIEEELKQIESEEEIRQFIKKTEDPVTEIIKEEDEEEDEDKAEGN